jgi:hypothetical protein
MYIKVQRIKADDRGLAEMVAQEWTNFLGQISVLPMDLVHRSSISSFCDLACFHCESCDVAARKVNIPENNPLLRPRTSGTKQKGELHAGLDGRCTV